MEINKRSPIQYDIRPIPGSVLVCEFKIKGQKNIVKINIELIIYHRRSNSANDVKKIGLISSGIQSIYTSTQDDIYTVNIRVPEFDIKNRTQSFLLVYIDNTENYYSRVNIESLTVEEYSQYLSRKNKKEEEFKKLIDKLKNKDGEPDVICEGLMFGDSGFAKAMRNVAFGLHTLGCQVRTVIHDKDNINTATTEKGSAINQLRAGPSDIHVEPYFWINMTYPLGVRYHDCCYNIGYVMFETETFPDVFAQNLTKQHEIWTPSTFCRDSIVKAGLPNVFVMPLGVDTELFNPSKVKPMQCPDKIDGKYKFLSVMGYSERKGVSTLIRAFAEEFKKEEDVILYIKGGWYHPHKAQEEINNVTKDIKDPPYIHLDFTIYPENILAQIYKMVDVFVLPTRGEGFGLPYAEAMSMELPTIGTRWSGNLDFMNDDNSYLIDINGVGPCPQCNWICPQYINANFAIPSKNHLKLLMRYVFEHRDDAKLKGKSAREYITKNFSWEISCKKMYKRLKDISQENI